MALFPLSLRVVEDMLAARGIIVSPPDREIVGEEIRHVLRR
jgi:transposase-like protein